VREREEGSRKGNNGNNRKMKRTIRKIMGSVLADISL
jgi:hypothetical protein